MGFEKLIEKLFEIIGLFQFWYVVQPNQHAILFRLGKVKKVVTAPGAYWKWLFNIDTVKKQSVATDTILWRGQLLITKDGIQVGSAASITWRISDILKYEMEVEDGENALIDISQPALLAVIKEMTWAEIVETPAQELDKRLTAAVRARQPGRWGIQVERVALSEFGRSRGLRLWQ